MAEGACQTDEAGGGDRCGGSSVENRLRRLLGAATSRFDHVRSEFREMQEHHDSLLDSLEQLLEV
jgi:hypothetical protein